MQPLKFPNQILDIDDPRIPWGEIAIVSSRKLDGNRGMYIPGVGLVTSAMKTPRNEHLPAFMKPLIKACERSGVMVDFELYNPDQEYHAITSGIINSIDKPLPKSLLVMVFDAASMKDFENECAQLPFRKRIDVYTDLLDGLPPRFVPVLQRPCDSPAQAMEFFEQDLSAGDEGSIIRTLDIITNRKTGKMRGGWYKHGRTTHNQAIGWKLKQYDTCDGVIVEVMQGRKMKDGIAREYTPEGRLVRPGSQTAYEPDNVVGSLKVRVTDDGDFHGVVTEIGFGIGFSIDERRKMWKNRKKLLGKHVEFTHMPHGAKGDRLRIGKLVKFRPDKDKE